MKTPKSMLSRLNRFLVHFVQKSFVLPVLMVSVPLLYSCQQDEENLEPVPYQVLDNILSTQDIIFNDIMDAIHDEQESIDAVFGSGEGNQSGNKLDQYSDLIDWAALRARKYKCYTINYHTTDPYGKPVIASGVVYYPKTGKPRGVVEALSFNKNKAQCPSKELANFEVLQGMAGFIVLVCDQIGCGTTESMVIPYLYYDNVAKVCADFRKAATELVRNVYGRSMPSFTLLSGISLAASEAWALARYYHMHPESGVNVNQVWMCGGPYKPSTVLEHQMRTLYTDYAFIPNALYSINHYENLGIDLQYVFKGELSRHYEEWCTGYIPIFQLFNRLGPDLTQYLNLDFFNDENPDYQRVKLAVKEKDIPNDWIPTCKIHIYHGRKDTYVPISSSDELVDYLKSVGADVEYVVTEEGHIDNCLTMAGDLAKFLYK